MPQSLCQILVHLVFSTKDRRPFIPQSIETELHNYVAQICRHNNSYVHNVGGTDDHIHLLCSLPRTITIANLVNHIKTGSSKWIKTKDSQSQQFAWQKGYGAFGISMSHKDAVCNYIATQRQHHQQLTFKDEFRRLLSKHQIDYDEKYVWE